MITYVALLESLQELPVLEVDEERVGPLVQRRIDVASLN